jgi:hypothetical protein
LLSFFRVIENAWRIELKVSRRVCRRTDRAAFFSARLSFGLLGFFDRDDCAMHSG